MWPYHIVLAWSLGGVISHMNNHVTANI